VVSELLGFQLPDGSFGPYTQPHDFQEWFGMSRSLVGLLEYYSVHPNPDVLVAAQRLGDYYVENYPDCAPCLYECYSTALEGLVLLARLSGDRRYLETAMRMAETSVVHRGLRFSLEMSPEGRRTPASGQVHCQLSTARGMLDLFEATGEPAYLERVLDLHAYIMKELLWVSGGIGFYYYRPEENETCADADWLRLNLQLWRLTGEAAYMNLAERILLNQLYFNQIDNGAFCYLRGLQNRAGAVFDACCSHHGPRALYDVLRYLFTSQGNTLWVNLFETAITKHALQVGQLTVSSQVRQEVGRLLFNLTFPQAPAEPFTLKVRIPDWSGPAGIQLNGQDMPGQNTAQEIAAGYAQITRSWSPGDHLELSLPLRVAVLRGQTLGQHILNPDEVAVFYGPRLFSLNDFHNPAVRLHLVRLRLPGEDLASGFRVVSPDHLEATGATPESDHQRLVFTPLAETGGVPSGAGRIHTVRSPYFKVWIPIEDRPLRYSDLAYTEP
jgi:DUF1680 family protein